MLLGPARVVARTVRIDAPLVVVVSVALVVMLDDRSVTRLEGGILALGLIAFTGFTLLQGRRESGEVKNEFEEGLATGLGVTPSVLLVLFGVGALVVGGNLMLEAAVSLARVAGLSEAVIGLTIVAVGTSLPELVTSLVAAYRGQGDIAVGNVLGSNVFNVLGILGVTALVLPLAPGGITAPTLAFMVASAVAVALMATTGRKITRIEGGVLLAAYAGYVGWLLLGA
jgi:cation:H+ antiporter